MVKTTPGWALKIYAQLWNNFQTSKFSRAQALEKIADTNFPQAISMLKKCGWLIIENDPIDSRKSLYSLKHPESIINEIGKK